MSYRYKCARCGADHHGSWQINCPYCARERTLVPEQVFAAMHPTPKAPPRPTDRYARYRDVVAKDPPRVATGIEGLDRVLGGGFARPSVTLFGGGQGSGKSSMITTACAGIRADPIVYVVAEEPEERLRGRGDRLGVSEGLEDLWIIETDEMAAIRDAVATIKPRVLIVDSISVLRDPEHDTNEELKNLIGYAKWFFDDAMANQRVTILISQLNKENDFAGARKIQYLLDVALVIEKIGKRVRKVSCPAKNRFGDTAEEAYFLMTKSGFTELSEQDAKLAEDPEGETRRPASETGGADAYHHPSLDDPPSEQDDRDERRRARERGAV